MRLKLIFAGLCCVAIMSAAKPITKGPNTQAKMTEKLHLKVALTDSQKLAVEQKANEYMLKRQKASLETNEDEAYRLKKQASEAYKSALDSILTNEQKLQLKQKADKSIDKSNNKPR